MLRLLRVRNFALIDALEIEFDRGFNLLSGETGAGKSLIVDALALAAGAKASADAIRSGEKRAVIEAVFDAPRDSDLEKIGIDPADELILRREISADNRNRVFINSQPSTVAALRAVAANLVDIHGQHEQQTLLDASDQLAVIDRATGSDDLRGRVRALYDAAGVLEDELAALERNEAEILQRVDLLAFQRDEIEQVRPKPGETDALRETVRRLEHSGKLFEAANGGYQALYEAEDSVLARVAGVERALAEILTFDPRLAAIMEQASSARLQIEDLAYALRDYLNQLEIDPGQVDDVQRRLAGLERLHRKYGADLLGHLDTVVRELDSIGLKETRRTEVTRRLDALRSDYRKAAEQLSRRRREGAARLEAEVTSELRSLAMPRADFSIRWTTLEKGRATGIDAPLLLLAANPGEEPGLLAAIASGGELSRTMLALRTVLAAEGSGRTLVFDEIDAGIGGEAAETVGRKLKHLSGSYQVLCVTHLAQIARFAGRHIRIEKHLDGGRTVTRVEELDAGERVEELARMMSGPRVSDAARKHVRELLGRS